MEQKLDIIKCYKEAWQCFKVRPGLAIGGLVVYFAVVYSGSIAQYLNAPVEFQYVYWLMYFFVFPPLMIGFSYLSLNLAGVAEPKWGDLLTGFKIYWKALGLYWLYMLIAIGVAIPGGIVIGILAIVTIGVGEYYVMLVILGLIYFAAILWIMTRWVLVFYVLVDEPSIGVIECLNRSSQITAGNRLRLIGVYCIMIPLVLLGVLALGLGIFVAMPIGMIAIARAYLWLKSFHPPVGATAEQQPAQ